MLRCLLNMNSCMHECLLDINVSVVALYKYIACMCYSINLSFSGILLHHDNSIAKQTAIKIYMKKIEH